MPAITLFPFIFLLSLTILFVSFMSDFPPFVRFGTFPAGSYTYDRLFLYLHLNRFWNINRCKFTVLSVSVSRYACISGTKVAGKHSLSYPAVTFNALIHWLHIPTLSFLKIIRCTFWRYSSLRLVDYLAPNGFAQTNPLLVRPIPHHFRINRTRSTDCRFRPVLRVLFSCKSVRNAQRLQHPGRFAYDYMQLSDYDLPTKRSPLLEGRSDGESGCAIQAPARRPVAYIPVRSGLIRIPLPDDSSFLGQCSGYPLP